MKQLITSVDKNSVAEYAGLEAGDAILTVNGHEIDDILDYYFYTEESTLELKLLTRQGEERLITVEKGESEPLGLHFEEEFMGCYRHCRNKCVFCFIDQLPKGMRDTLYFKDDDSRLSFLNGNYITMTNMSDADFEKIIRYHMSPMNISVHTTNPELRCRMLNNKNAGDVLEKMRRLVDNGIVLNAQIVLCRGLNDGIELARTIEDLYSLAPQLQSVSIVPVGLTKYREGLYPLEPFDADYCAKLIDNIAAYQKRFLEEKGTHFVHLSDEFYSVSGRELPDEDSYDSYPQIENGVGMMRSFIDEAEAELEILAAEKNKKGLAAALERAFSAKMKHKCVKKSLVTAVCAEKYIKDIVNKTKVLFPELDVDVITVKNNFFGDRITVSGLLTGQDIAAQLSGRELGKIVLIPANSLRGDDNIFLDDITVSGLEEALHTPVKVVKSLGSSFVRELIE